MDLDRYLQALAFAVERHAAQKRKDGAPYIVHPVEVAEILRSHGIDDAPTLTAALLHDVIEDTATRYEDIEQRFGAEVADLVVECSDDRRLPQARRKLAQIENASHKSTRARAIKIADKLANLRSLQRTPPANWSLQRIQDYFDWAGRVFEALSGAHPELEASFREVHRRGAAGDAG